MGVSENSGTPKSSILIGFSIIFTIHVFMDLMASWAWEHPKEVYVYNYYYNYSILYLITSILFDEMIVNSVMWANLKQKVRFVLHFRVYSAAKKIDKYIPVVPHEAVPEVSKR